jgi:hypothetical protein
LSISDQRRDTTAVDIDAVAPAVRASRLGRIVSAFWSRLLAAHEDSRAARAAAVLKAWLGSLDLVARIAFVGCLLTAAMAVHILLVVFVEPYPFPSRSALIVPATLMVLALSSIVLRRTLAAAWRDRHGR